MQVDEVTKANYKALKARRDDEVVGRLKKELDAFKDVMPLLAEVGVMRDCGDRGSNPRA